MRELILAEGPARYLGGSIETFALPMAAFIVIALALYYIFRRPHSVPRMKYLTPASQTSVGTREPGTAALAVVPGPIPASAPVAEATTAVPGAQAPHAAETVPHPDVAAGDQAAPGAADQAAPGVADQADQPEGDA